MKYHITCIILIILIGLLLINCKKSKSSTNCGCNGKSENFYLEDGKIQRFVSKKLIKTANENFIPEYTSNEKKLLKSYSPFFRN
jgi:hypothetical protein